MKTDWEHIQRGTYHFLPSRTLGVHIEFYSRKWWVICFPGQVSFETGPFATKADAMEWTERKWREMKNDGNRMAAVKKVC